MATLYGRTEVVELLIEKGARVSTPGRDGNTPLHIASFFGYEEIVDVLLANDCQVTAKNDKGETATDVVSQTWSDALEATYGRLGSALGLDLRMDQIKEVRPRIAKKLSAASHKEE